MGSGGEQRHNVPPIYEIVDVAEVSPTLTQDHDRAHAFVWYQMQDMLDVYVNSPEETAEKAPKELVHWLAFERQLATSLEIEKVNHAQRIGNAAMLSVHALRDMGKVIRAMGEAETLSPDQVHEYFYGQLSQYHEFLTGKPQTTPTEDRPARIHDAMHYVYLAESLQVNIWHNNNFSSSDEHERLWEEISGIAHLFLDANKINLAISYLAFAPTRQAEDEIIQKLATKLCEDPAYSDRGVYIKMFQNILHALPHKRQWSLFIEEVDKRQHH